MNIWGLLLCFITETKAWDQWRKLQNNWIERHKNIKAKRDWHTQQALKQLYQDFRDYQGEQPKKDMVLVLQNYRNYTPGKIRVEEPQRQDGKYFKISALDEIPSSDHRPKKDWWENPVEEKQ